VADTRTTEEIVVGVDGSAGSEAALRWALAEARLRGSRVRVVRAYQVPTLIYGDGGLGASVSAAQTGLAEDIERLRAALEAESRREIEDVLGRMGDDIANEVQVELDVVEGPAAQVLLEAARNSELLVVGSRGRGGFLGLLLGSVSQQCAHHPPCPVVILPAPKEST
jgi:nucleotide-binding universal stress UspA family protein